MAAGEVFSALVGLIFILLYRRFLDFESTYLTYAYPLKKYCKSYIYTFLR